MGSSVGREAKNPVIFRAVNDEIRKISDNLWGGEDTTIEVFCECARAGCLARIVMPMDEYGRQRLSPARFVVAAGHDDPGVHRVVEAFGGWVSVENVGRGAELASASLSSE
jgi:hypothetical protein